MNTVFCNVKATTGRMLDLERRTVWLAFISIPKGKFLSAAIDVQERYIRELCDHTRKLGESALWG